MEWMDQDPVCHSSLTKVTVNAPEQKLRQGNQIDNQSINQQYIVSKADHPDRLWLLNRIVYTSDLTMWPVVVCVYFWDNLAGSEDV